MGTHVKRILIVEDDAVSSQALSDFLAAHGYTTEVARTGQEGLERFRSYRPHLMLVDVQLPLKSGFELCFEVRRADGGQRLPIVLMSAVYTDVEHAVPYATRGLGAQGYLVKPFSLRAMLDRVESLIG
jgi:DNA-binding response OmpR family regulator